MIGTKLGQYEITEEIGKGGMATVYRAYHKSMDRHVAIKVIRSSILSDKNVRERFNREAKLIAKLEHPHLLPVYDFDGKSDTPYIVMRFLEGGTLKQVMQNGNLPQGEMLYMLRQIASSLDYAHRQNIVHRDLKPSNIMIDKEGNAFVADFGIARVDNPEEGEHLTETGAAVGTPAYMSPEQAKGEAQLDNRTDIYALAVIIFEMLAGEHPYPKSSPIETLMAHIQDPVPNIRDVNNKLPKALDKVMQSALAKEKDERYPSAGALVDAVAEALKAEPSSAPEKLREMTGQFAADQLETIMRATEPTTDGSSGSKERQRQLTAAYLDLTEWAEVLYAEHDEQTTVKKMMNDLWDEVRQIANNYQGNLHSRTDEVGVALWGIDATSEIDPEQAIRATLDIKNLVLREAKKLWGDDYESTEENPLPFVAGINTGPVVLELDDKTGTQTATGPTITLAGKLKDVSPHGEILVAHDTFTHVRGIFTFQPGTPIRVRGRKNLLDVYIAVQAKPRAFRSQARGVEGVETKMIGREIELRVLQNALSLTMEDGETQVVTVVGDAGVGKSRLLFEFFTWMELLEQTLWFFEARATQPSELQPYSLTRDLFSFRFEIADNDPLPVVRKKFEEGVCGFLGEGNEDKARLIGQLVGFDFSEDEIVKDALQNPEAFQEKALGLLGDLFTTAAATNPVFIQVEDIHWADDRSLDLLNSLANDNQDLPLFIIYMTRPRLYERRPSWGEGQLFHHKVQLEPLARLDARMLVKEILKLVDDVPKEMRDLIIDRAEGNPFYIEELIKSLIDDKVILKSDKEWTIDIQQFSEMRVPQTLTGVIQARLDTLEPNQRALLQRASVVGRVFWESAATYLGNYDGQATNTTISLLEALREREMVLKREESNFEGTSEYLFRHAILRDVTYESIVPQQRREYHKQVADWLIKVSGERLHEYTILIAEHYQMADEFDLAAEQLLHAGEKAKTMGTLEESMALHRKGLEFLDPEKHTASWLKTTMALSDTLGNTGQLGEVRKILEEAEPIAKKHGDPKLESDHKVHMGRVLLMLGENDLSNKYLQEALGMIQKLDDKYREAFVLRQLGNLNVGIGEFEKSENYLTQSIAIAKEIQDADLEVTALNSLANVSSARKDHQKAIDLYTEAIDLAYEHKVNNMLVYMIGNRAGQYYELKDWDKLREGAEELFKLATEQNNPHFITTAKELKAELALQEGDIDGSLAFCRQALEFYLSAENTYNALGTIPSISRCLFARGEVEKGLAWTGMALADPRVPQFIIDDFTEEIQESLPDMSLEEIKAGFAKGEKLEQEKVFEEILAGL